jgi:toxin ParE1/3/4
MRVIWNDDALDDLEAIRDYIENSNPAAAERVFNRLLAGLQQLAFTPGIGRAGRVPETREFVFSDVPYIGIYRIETDPDRIEILNVLHTARDYPPKK